MLVPFSLRKRFRWSQLFCYLHMNYKDSMCKSKLFSWINFLIVPRSFLAHYKQTPPSLIIVELCLICLWITASQSIRNKVITFFRISSGLAKSHCWWITWLWFLILRIMALILDFYQKLIFHSKDWREFFYLSSWLNFIFIFQFTLSWKYWTYKVEQNFFFIFCKWITKLSISFLQKA